MILSGGRPLLSYYSVQLFLTPQAQVSNQPASMHTLALFCAPEPAAAARRPVPHALRRALRLHRHGAAVRPAGGDGGHPAHQPCLLLAREGRLSGLPSAYSECARGAGRRGLRRVRYNSPVMDWTSLALSWTLWTPLIGAVLLMLVPKGQELVARAVALTITLITLGMAGVLFLGFNPNVVGYQFVERFAWLPDYGVSYFLGHRRGEFVAGGADRAAERVRRRAVVQCPRARARIFDMDACAGERAAGRVYGVGCHPVLCIFRADARAVIFSD
jgi:hypothetical protein